MRRLLWKTNAHFNVQNTLTMNAVLRQLNVFHILTLIIRYLFNINLSFRIGYSMHLLLFQYSERNCMNFPPFTLATCPTHLIVLHLLNLITIDEKQKLQSYWLCNLCNILLPSVIPFPLCTIALFSTLFSNMFPPKILRNIFIKFGTECGQ